MASEPSVQDVFIRWIQTRGHRGDLNGTSPGLLPPAALPHPSHSSHSQSFPPLPAVPHLLMREREGERERTHWALKGVGN